MKIRVSELEGISLDWAVAKSVKAQAVNAPIQHWLSPIRYSPSTLWSQCGPLIEDSKVAWHYLEDDIVEAWVTGLSISTCYVGPTPLVAACRALVAHKLEEEDNDSIDVPDELLFKPR
jgi:hypothetical protein